MSPYHPVRMAIDRIIEPMLAPIRRVVPSAGMFDFSPLILMILIELIDRILIFIILHL
jgi:YggT family protein